jgi:hypothetical protein
MRGARSNARPYREKPVTKVLPGAIPEKIAYRRASDAPRNAP